MKFYKITFFVASFIALAACTSNPQEQATIEEERADFIPISATQQEMAGITFGPITTQNVEQTLACSGQVDVPPANRISLTTVYGGYITYTGVYPGDKVRKGQLLAKLQDPMYIDLQRGYLEGKSKLAFVEADYARKQRLMETQSVSDKQLQQTKREYESVAVEVQALAAQLKMAGFSIALIEEKGVQPEVEVRAPIDGFVTAVNINQGLHLAEGDALFELIDPTHVHIELAVFPNDLPKLAEGQKVYYRIAGDDVIRTGNIKLINKAVGQAKSIMVHVHPAQEDENAIIPGTFVQAEIVYAAQEAQVLPIEAVNETESGYIAYKRVEGGVEAIHFVPRFTTQNVVDAAVLDAATYLLHGAEKLITLEDEGEHDH